MTELNRRLLLAERPSGNVDETTVRVEEQDAPEPGPGQALARVATCRSIRRSAPGWTTASATSADWHRQGRSQWWDRRGDREQHRPLYARRSVFGMTGWQDWVLADEGAGAMQKLPPGVPPTAALNVFGVTGMTAYFGLIDVGKVKEGDIVGSGRRGRHRIDGWPDRPDKGRLDRRGHRRQREKCAWIVEELGFDAAINYKTDDVPAALRRACPDGIDLYFDNVGGPILNTCLGQLALRGRVVLCGAIAGYNDASRLVARPTTSTSSPAEGGWRASSSSTTSTASPRGRPRWPAGWARAGSSRSSTSWRASSSARCAQPAVHRREHGKGDRRRLTLSPGAHP